MTGASPPGARLRLGGATLARSAHRALPVLGAAVVVCLALLVLGENPFTTIRYMVVGALGAEYNVSETLMVMVPLILCGLAAAIPFSARLWNIGADGQMYVGAVAAVTVGLELGKSVPGPLLAAFCVLAGIAAGSAWAILAALVKIGVAGNEVIVTLMLNLVAALLVDYTVTGLYPQGIEPQTKSIPRAAQFGSFWQSGFNEALFIGLAVAAAAALFMWRTKAGFGIRAAGLNVDAARLAGFAVKRLWLGAFALGGAFAGLAGALLVVATYGTLIPGMGGQYGYTGIAVALVARLRPLLVIPAALLFSVIEVGGSGLAASAQISPSIAYVIESVIVISLIGFKVLRVRA